MGRFAFAAVSLVLTASVVMPDASAREPRSRGRAVAAPAEVHDVLAAESAGLVSVKYIPNDSRSAQIVVTNRSDRPLTLRLPDQFAGVPVLAQMGMGGGGGGQAGFGAGGIGASPQTTGGAAPQQGGMGIGGAQGGGMFSLPPEKTRVVKVTTVCLEHGKPEPSPLRPYKLVELESYSDDPRLAELMTSIGRGEVSQKVAQAAAWHIANGLTWEQLAAEKIDHAGGDPDEPFLTPAELRAASQVVAIVAKRAAAAAPSTSGS
jgi:hypothetical protein